MIYNLYFHQLARHPGPLLWRISILPSLYYAWTGDRHLVIDKLHKKYGETSNQHICVVVSRGSTRS